MSLLLFQPTAEVACRKSTFVLQLPVFEEETMLLLDVPADIFGIQGQAPLGALGDAMFHRCRHRFDNVRLKL